MQENKERILNLYLEENLNGEEVAKKLGIASWIVYKVLKELGIKKKRSKYKKVGKYTRTPEIINKRVKTCKERGIFKKFSERMKKDNPVKDEKVREKIKNTLKLKCSTGEIIPTFSNKEKFAEIKIANSKRMKKNNPMKNIETAKKMANTIKRKFESGELISYWKGKKNPGVSIRNKNNLELMKKLRKILTDPEFIKKNTQKAKERWQNKEWKIKMCKLIKEALNRPEVKQKHSNTMKNKWAENKNFRMSVTEKLKVLWLNEEYANERIKKTLKSLRIRPTSYEQKISDLCIKYYLPFFYTGNGTFFIGRKNPDFIHKDKEKRIAIEVYNDYHKLKNFKSYEEYEKQRSEYFFKYGYQIIFINSKEILDKNWEEICLNKINGILNGQSL